MADPITLVELIPMPLTSKTTEGQILRERNKTSPIAPGVNLYTTALLVITYYSLSMRKFRYKSNLRQQNTLDCHSYKVGIDLRLRYLAAIIKKRRETSSRDN